MAGDGVNHVLQQRYPLERVDAEDIQGDLDFLRMYREASRQEWPHRDRLNSLLTCPAGKLLLEAACEEIESLRVDAARWRWAIADADNIEAVDFEYGRRNLEGFLACVDAMMNDK